MTKRLLTISAVVCAALVAAGTAVGMPMTAMASDSAPSPITVAGAPLDGSVRASGSFTAVVAAPAGTTEVKFVLDGTYLGQVAAPPYAWPIATTSGTHKLKVRWKGADADAAVANFAVGATARDVASSSAVGASSTRASRSAKATIAPKTSIAIIPPSQGTASVSTAAGLVAALASAAPGETISLADGVYRGTFTASLSGTAAHPITLTGSRGAVLTAGGIRSGYGLHVTGSYWTISGISVTNSSKGIVLDASQYTVIDGVDVGNIGLEGVHFRHSSSHSRLINSSVHDTGRKTAGYGEGVYIGSAHSNWSSVMGSSSIPDATSDVLVQNNRITNTTAEGIDIKEGTSGGRVLGNVFTNAGYSGANYGDSWVDVKGNGYLVSGNSGSGTKTDAFQVHRAIAGWGNSTVFENNTVTGGVSGYLYNVQSGVTGTVIHCQSTLAGRGLSNVGCR